MAGRPLAAVVTLGCKLNLADSDEIARGLRAGGFDVVDRLCDADAVVVNTCSVTHLADRKSRKLIRAARRIAPGAAVAVTGCHPRSAGADAVLELGADIVAGTRDGDKADLVRFLVGRVRPDAPSTQLINREDSIRTRAFVKAQEGCNDVCAFCIVPRTRGREESRSIASVVAEVGLAETSGVREVVITGTQLGAWGRDFARPLKPHDLIAALLVQTGVSRIRFSSLQPQDITPELLALWDDPRLMRHFHLALQSGSDATLSRMRRRYSVMEFRRALACIRAAVRDAAVTTDVIAGFPGENEADFAETLAFCRESRFARVHAFPYSVRRGTAAARMESQLPPEIVRERMTRLLAVARELAQAHRLEAAGSVRPVLWEEEREVDGERLWFGHSETYLAVAMAGEGLRNQISSVELGEPFLDGVRGSALVAPE